MWINYIKRFEELDEDFTYNKRRITVKKLWRKYRDEGGELTFKEALEQAVEQGYAIKYFKAYFVLIMTDNVGEPLEKGCKEEAIKHADEYLERYRESGLKSLATLSLKLVYNEYVKNKEEKGERMLTMREFCRILGENGKIAYREVNRNLFLRR